MGQYTLFDVGLFLLTISILHRTDAACPELKPTKKLLCYLDLKGSPPPLDTCLCTHLVVTTPINKLTADPDILNNVNVMKKRNPDLLVLGLATDAAEVAIKRRGAYVRGLISVLRKTDLDGIELDLKWHNKNNGKETFVELVKLLSTEINKLNETFSTNLRRRERNAEDEYPDEEGISTESESAEETGATTLTDATTSATTIKEENEEAGNKEDKTKEKDNEEEEFVDETSDKRPIVVRIPTQPQIIAKNFDLKRLSKYVNFFTISSENVTDASEAGLTYHPSRLMGIEDILNADSLVDLITGLGAPHPKLVLSLPNFALRFKLINSDKNLPLSPTVGSPQRISQAELCTLMSHGTWTVERDEDLTAPYAFQNDTWLAFDDPTSTAIKGKYILLRDLAGAAIVSLDYEDWLGKCNKSALTILPTLYDTFTNVARKSRAAQLISLQEQIHQSSPFAFSADIQLSPYRIVRVVDRAGSIHVVRKEAKTEFECSRQGYFRHPSGCNRFYRCVKFNQYSPDYTVFEYDCPAGLAFDEKYEVCVWPGSLEDGGACQGSSEIAPVPRERYVCPRVEGYYADPENCRWFFACLDHVRDGATPLTAYEFRCPFGLVFNEQTLTCDWPWNVAGCGTAGSFRARLTVGDILEGRTRASYATVPDYHVSGGRIEGAPGAGVVLGSLLPGVVSGSLYQGAYSAGSKYDAGSGVYQGAGHQVNGYGSNGAALGENYGGSSLSGIYSGASDKFAGGSYSGIYGGQYSGLNGIHSGTSQYYSGSNKYAGSGGVKYSDGNDVYSGNSYLGSGLYSGASGTGQGAIYSGSKFDGSGQYYGTGNAGTYTGLKSTLQGNEYASGSGFGSAIGAGFGTTNVGIGKGDSAYGYKVSTTGISSGLSGGGGAYDADHVVTGSGIGAGYYAGAQSGSGKTVIHGTPISHSTFGSSSYGNNLNLASGLAVTPAPAGGPGFDYKNTDFVNSLTSNLYGSNSAGSAFNQGHGFVSSTPAPPITQFHVATPTASTPLVTPSPIPISTFKTPLSTPRPFTYYLPPEGPQFPAASPKPIQHFGSSLSFHEAAVTPAPISHAAIPLVPFSPSPAPTVVTTKDSSEFGLHEVSRPLIVPSALPPASPVSYFNEYSYKKPVIPVSTTNIAVPVSTPITPVSYQPRPYPVPVESYHISKPVVPIAVPVSTPAPPLHSFKYNYPKFQPALPAVHTEYVDHDVRPGAPVSSIHFSTPAPPVKYYPAPQPAIPVSTVAPPVAVHVSTPAPFVPVSSPAPPVKYYPPPQPVVPIHTEKIETYYQAKPAVGVHIPVSTPSPINVGYSYSTPLSTAVHTEDFSGYHYSKPAIGFSYPKPSNEVFKSIVTTSAPTVTQTPLFVSSTPAYSAASFGYEKELVKGTYPQILPVQHKNVEVGYTYENFPLHKVPQPVLPSIPLKPYPQPVDYNYKYKEVAHEIPLVTPAPLLPAPAKPILQTYEVPHTYPKPALPIIPLAPVQSKPAPILPKLPVVTPPPQVIHYKEYNGYNGYNYQKPVPSPLPPVSYGYSYSKPAVSLPIVPAITPAPKNYYNVPAPVPVSNVQYGLAYEKQVPLQPVQYSTVAPPVQPIVHYETVTPSPPPVVAYKPPASSFSSIEFNKISEVKPQIQISSPRPFAFKEPDYAVQYSTTPAPIPTVKPFDYDYSYKAPTPIVPAIQVTSTPLPPLNPVTYTYKQPVVKFQSPAISYGFPTPPPVIQTYKQTYLSTLAPPPAKINYAQPVLPYAPPPPPPLPAKINYGEPGLPYLPPPAAKINYGQPILPNLPILPPKVDFVQPTYAPPVQKATPSYVKPLPPIVNSTPSPFKPTGFSQLGPKYKLVDSYHFGGYDSVAPSTPVPPVPVVPAEISSVKFGYAYEKPVLPVYSAPAPIEVSSVTPPPLAIHEFKSTINPPIYVPPAPLDTGYSKSYIKTQTVIPAYSSTFLPPPEPVPEIPMYQRVINAFKAPVVTAYEKVLNVLKTQTPAAPVYVNHYTSSTPAPEVIPVTTIKPAIAVVPHRFEYTSGVDKLANQDGLLYETLKSEYGSKLKTQYEQGYDYPKPVVPIVDNIHNLKIPSTTYRPLVKKVYTAQQPSNLDVFNYNAGNQEFLYTSTPAPASYSTFSTYKPDFKQYIQEVYSTPATPIGGYPSGEGYINGYNNVQFLTSTSSPLPPVTTARVSLPIVKTGCVNCGLSKSQRIKVNPPIYPLPVTYSTTPATTISSTSGYSYTSPVVSTSTLGYSEEEAEEHELEIANAEEEEGAKILEQYSNSGQFGGVLSSSVGSKGIHLSGGALSSTTVSSLQDGEAIVGVVKKEKNIYTGRNDKAKVVVVSRLSDFNPILVGKLGAECSCKSNPVNLKNHRTGDISNHRTTNLFVPDGPQDYVYNQPALYTSSSLAPIIVPDSVGYPNGAIFGDKSSQGSSIVEIKPSIQRIKSTFAPTTNAIPFYETVYSTTESTPIYSISPSTTTVVYEEPTKKSFNTLVRHKPVYVEKSLRPSYQQLLVPTIPAQTIVDLDAETKVTSGKSFDRYGPGGLRGVDETLQGSVDCKRPGLFRHPKYCNKFYSCNWDQWKKRYTLHVFNCPVHLAYDSQLGACNWPSKGPACADDNLLV